MNKVLDKARKPKLFPHIYFNVTLYDTSSKKSLDTICLNAFSQNTCTLQIYQVCKLCNHDIHV